MDRCTNKLNGMIVCVRVLCLEELCKNLAKNTESRLHLRLLSSKGRAKEVHTLEYQKNALSVTWELKIRQATHILYGYSAADQLRCALRRRRHEDTRGHHHQTRLETTLE
jgi:hypothetical protein